ncbi:MAG: hypothetical protein ACM3PU_11020, partial [Gemmatimonadota bacterium]
STAALRRTSSRTVERASSGAESLQATKSARIADDVGVLDAGAALEPRAVFFCRDASSGS